MAIQLRRRTYFASLDVPQDLRAKLGRRVFRKTLDTSSLAIAKRRAAVQIAKWKAEIEAARGNPDSDDATYWRERLRRAKPEERQHVLEMIEMVAVDLGATAVDRIGQAPMSAPEAQRFYGVATGARVGTTDYLDEWIRQLQVKPKTAAMRRAAVVRLSEKFALLSDITRPGVVRWVNDLRGDGLSSATVGRMLSDVRGYWRYLVSIEMAPEDALPFEGLKLKVHSASWLPYAPEEAVRLLNAASNDPQLEALIRLAMYTGARREELCALTLEHVKTDRFNIVDAKTPAGVREVPIHPEIRATILTLRGKRTKGHLLAGLEANKYGIRGNLLGKRFTALKRRLGFSNRHVLHSFRGTVITILEHAGVPEGTVQDLVGHERSTLTGSTYSGKSTFEMKRDAAERLSYPSA